MKAALLHGLSVVAFLGISYAVWYLMRTVSWGWIAGVIWLGWFIWSLCSIGNDRRNWRYSQFGTDYDSH